MTTIDLTSAVRALRLLACLAAIAAALTVAACGSAGSRASTGSTSGAQSQARLNLAKCFRAHGINVPDPSSGGGPAGGGGGGIFRALRQYPQAQINAARQACQQYFAQAFPQLNLSPAQRAQFQQQLVKFAQCMRSHGINVPDPQFNGNGGGPGAGFGFRRQFRSIDRNSPAFQSANQACASLRPRLGRGGPGGAGGAGGPGA
jgi:hypothetical protein